MAANSELKEITQEIQRKIGRNLLLFQKVEHMLKFLVSRSSLSGNMSEFKENAKEKIKQTEGDTLGKVKNQFFIDFMPDPDIEESSESLPKGHFSIKFSYKTDSNFYQFRKKQLDALTDERNEFVHHLLPKLFDESMANFQTIEIHLDQQKDRIQSEVDALKAMMEALKMAADKLPELKSNNIEKQNTLSELRGNNFILLLGKIAQEIANSEGWASLALAGKIIKQELSEEEDALKKQYGYKNLKEIIKAPEIFDVYEKKKGDWLYKLNEDWNLEPVTT